MSEESEDFFEYTRGKKIPPEGIPGFDFSDPESIVEFTKYVVCMHLRREIKMSFKFIGLTDYESFIRCEIHSLIHIDELKCKNEEMQMAWKELYRVHTRSVGLLRLALMENVIAYLGINLSSSSLS